MNYGIVAREYGHRPGTAVWEWSAKTRQGLALFARTMMQWRASGQPDQPWHECFSHVIGRVRVFPEQDYYEDYAMFRPNDLHEFSQMCVRCQGYSGSPALVAPASTGGDQAVRILEDFYSIAHRLSFREMRNRPLARVARRIPIEIEWAYLIGFYADLPLTFFMSERREVVDTFRKHLLEPFLDYELQEQWGRD